MRSRASRKLKPARLSCFCCCLKAQTPAAKVRFHFRTVSPTPRFFLPLAPADHPLTGYRSHPTSPFAPRAGGPSGVSCFELFTSGRRSHLLSFAQSLCFRSRIFDLRSSICAISDLRTAIFHLASAISQAIQRR